jgi:hypothetical protein
LLYNFSFYTLGLELIATSLDKVFVGKGILVNCALFFFFLPSYFLSFFGARGRG